MVIVSLFEVLCDGFEYYVDPSKWSELEILSGSDEM